MKISLLTSSSLLAFAALVWSSDASAAQKSPTLAMSDQDARSSASGPAAAQPDDRRVPDIIVTANRREESVQKVAGSVTALTGEKLQMQGVRSSNELAQVVPNVTVDTTFLTSAPRIFIRGIGTSDSSGVASSPVGVYIDDVYLGAQDGLAFQLFDLKRVEVVKGPQGTLYGRNTTAGAINYISNTPTSDFSGNGEIRVGNYHDFAAEGAISGPISGSLLGRLAFSYEHRDGVVTDPVTGDRNGNGIKNIGLKGAFSWEPTSQLKISLNLRYTHADPYAGVYKGRGYLVPGTATPCATTQVLSFQCADVLGFVPNSDLFSVHTTTKGRDRNEGYGGGLHVAYDFGWATLTSITGFNQTNVARLEDSGDGSGFPLININYDHHTREFTQELRLTSPGGKRLNWIVGAYYYYEKPHVHDVYYSPLASPLPFEQTYGQTDRAYALYGRADSAIVPGLTLAIGVRYTTEKKAFFETAGLNEPAMALFGVPANPAGPVINFFSTTLSRTDGQFSGDISLAYQISDEQMAYAKISRGFKSGGFNGGLVQSAQSVTSFAPEILTSYEAGLKSQFLDKDLTVNASVFYYDYRDLQVQTLSTIGGIPFPVVDNAASAHVYGAELAAILRPTSTLRFDASIGLLSAKFTSYLSTGTGANYTGNRLAGSPKVTASIGANYAQPVGHEHVAFVDVQSSYRSRNQFDASNSPLISQAGYWLANASIGFGSASGTWTFSVWAKNVFDKKYYRDIINFENSFGYDGIAVGDPRTFGVQLSTRW